jgi:acetolactate synthase-1/2/3 large subunit
MIRVADYIAEIVSRCGVTQVFMVTGGGAMHLNDAFSRHPSLQTLCMHHEQACAMAAEGYARVRGKMALVNVTTGPGGLNALNGVFGAYTDSVPMIVVSGQVKRETFVGNQPLPLRQLGDQEVDICAVARPIVKYACLLNDPADVRYEIEKAIWIAENGRPGPVWVDVPVDVQGALVNPSDLRGFDASREEAFSDGATTPNEAGAIGGAALESAAVAVLDAIRRAERPIILAGSGVRTAGAVESFRALIDRLGLPVTTAFNAHDLLHEDHPLFVGRPGTIGDRGGNFSVQNADLVIILGCRLNIRQISYNYESFARKAKKIMVDVDAAELKKHTLSIDWPIHADLKPFIEALLAATSGHAPSDAHSWFLSWCKERKRRYPVELPEYFEKKTPVNPYAFAKLLFDELAADDIIVTANATACIVTFQCAKLQEGQRLFSNSGSASMGFDLPAAIGACVAAGGRRIVCLAGDGSIMMNLQEMQTIVGARLPIKIFLLDNNGYHSILQTQTAFFSDNIFGCNPANGVSFPDFERVGAAFGLMVEKCDHLDHVRSAIRATLDASGPVLCHVRLDPAQPFAPKLSSRRLADGRMVSASLEDMAPFLPREEFASNMLNSGDE